MRLRQAAKTGIVASAAVLFVAAAPAAIAQHTGSRAAAAPGVTGPVSLHPVTTTPHLPPNDNPPQQIRQIVQCRGTVYVVGTFTTLEQGSKTFVRHNAASFSARAPYTMTSWAPRINGTVNSIAFNGTNCADAYIGGSFKKINTTLAQNLGKISTAAGTGAVVKKFGHSVNGTVQTLRAVGGHLLVGGQYTNINGGKAAPYLTSVSLVTGKNDKYLNLHIKGNYKFPGSQPNATRVYNQALSHSGKLDLVMGDFTSAGGRRRQQIFMLSLGKAQGTVTGWTSPEFDGSQGNLPGGFQYQCSTDNTFYVRAAAWSPDDKTIYLADTGYRPWNSTVTDPRSGLCDSASAWPATHKSVLHLWINYTGCDSLYSVAADASTVYFAGHERWSENPDGCDTEGHDAILAPGFEGLSPKTGHLTFNPTRDRGLGADDMLLTKAGLWIASDNFDHSQACGGVENLAGICLLPYK
ncbi:MAG TPA: hypothetical protein VFQ44_13910 [Streptosporangiaceae bacterium]|nr:hypothetical protein [Streptosporangiaceae bacterium]